ncbi:MAG: hypothetical protein ACT4QF_22630 [Sporichthyaceae bacterium]
MDDASFEVLNAVYLRKIATADHVAVVALQPVDAVRATLAALGEQGFVEDLGGQFMLSEEGTQATLAGYEERYAKLREDDEVETWYQRFETLNSQFLVVISAWQTSGEDEGALDKVLKLINRQIRSLDNISDVIPRYAKYSQRFAKSLEIVENGNSEYVTSLSVDSLHNIWFEFHEDVLTLLGRPRLDAEEH